MDAHEWYIIEVRMDGHPWFPLKSTYNTRDEANRAFADVRSGPGIQDARIIRHQTFRSIVEPPEPILKERADASP